MQKGDIFGIIIVLAVLSGIAVLFALAPEAAPSVYAPVEITGSTVSVQGAEGDRGVRVNAEVKEPGFVTVHQGLGEAPGPVIGSSGLLEVGTHQDLTINVTEMLSPATTYFVLLFVDDGDRIYEPGIDLPVMSNGQVVKQALSL